MAATPEHHPAGCLEFAKSPISTGEPWICVHINDAGARLIGQTREACLGRELSAFLNAPQVEIINDLMQRLDSGLHEASASIPVAHAELSINMMVSRSGYIATLTQAQGELLSSAGFTTGVLEEVLQRSVIAITFCDTRGVIQFGNKALSELVGYSYDELMGMNIAQLVHPDDFAADAALARQLLAGGIDQVTGDKRYIHKDGHEILVAAALSVARPPGSSGPLVVGQARDVRDERRISRNLENALLQAQEAARLKSEFLANMSHEIRTPLNGVIGMAQVLGVGELTADQREQIKIIQDSGSSLLSLLNDILDLSKVEAGKIEISNAPTDVREIIQALVTVHRVKAEQKNVKMRAVLDAATPRQLLIDPLRLRQCVENLISNAVKFTDTGRITVGLSSEKLSDKTVALRIRVADTGTGIPADKLGRIFESFSQADGSITRSHGGTGLGLTITQSLARMMGGDVTVESTLGEGSTFTLTVIASTVDASARASNNTPTATKARAFEGARVLIVDDNQINRQVAQAFLKRLKCETAEADSGLAALEMLAAETFDVVLLDIQMPGIDGVETLEQLRASPKQWCSTPTIALTAEAMSGDKERFLELGFDDYISKPIRIADLTKVLEATLAKATKSDDAAA